MRTTPRIIISFAAVILSFFMFPHISSAQEFDPIPLGGSLDLYVGTWKYENAETNEIFIVRLKKFDNYNHLGAEEFGSIIIGEYSYSRNNETIHNSINNLQKVVSNEDAFDASIKGFGNHKDQDYNKLKVWLCDRSYVKVTSGDMQVSIGRKGYTLLWKMSENTGDHDVFDLINDGTPSGLSIPSDIVLIKVEE